MPDYSEMILHDLNSAGWAAEVTEPSLGRFVARGRKAGNACVVVSANDLGAVVGLLKSVREVEAGRMFAAGMVVKLREPFGDLREGHYVAEAVGEDGLRLRTLVENLESGNLVGCEAVFHLPMQEADRAQRTGLILG